MTQEPEIPALPRPDLEGVDYEMWGQNVKADCWFEKKMRAYATAAVLAERERLSTRLRAEIALDGFGCACEPAFKCGTCKARDVLQKVLGPIVKELAPPAKEPT